MHVRSIGDVAGLPEAAATGHMKATFSQLGEDCILWWLFHAKREGFYVDVGCHDPVRFSNTAALHIFNGWRGLNIDVDERAIAAFRAARPNDINVCCGVAGEAGRLEVTIFEEGAVNSLDPAAAANPGWGPVREKKMVDVRPLGDLLHEYVKDGTTVDFLNVDAEGLDFQVLSSNDWAVFRPHAIAVEDHTFDLSNPPASNTFKLLQSYNYRLISHLVVTSIYRLV